MNVEALVVEHFDWIRNRARWYYPDEMDAEDLAGETIFKCLSQGKKNYDRTQAFKPWALAIMANTYITQYNRRRRVLFTGYNAGLPYPDDSHTDSRLSLRRIIAIIRESARRSCCVECVLLYAKGYSYAEIALIKNIPVGTVKSRVASGRQMLRDALECQ